jgi:hypothetical protein
MLREFDATADTFNGLTGLDETSAGLIISTITDNEAAATPYTQASGNVEDITSGGTLGVFAAPTAGKCRFEEVDATNHPGLYEIQIADARFAIASARALYITISGASGLQNTVFKVPLVAYDPYDVVRLGLTSLPNAAADAAGGLPISDAGGLDLDAHAALLSTVDGKVDTIDGKIDDVDTVVDTILVDTNELQADWADGGRLDLLLDAVKAKTDQLAFTIANKVDSSIQAAADLSDAAALKIWHQTLTGITTASTIGKKLKDLVLGSDNKVEVSADTHTAGVTVDGVTNSVSVDAITDKTGYALSSAALTAIEDEILDAAISGHTGSGSVGEAITNSGTDPLGVSVPGAYGAGTVGKLIGDNLNETVSSRSSLSIADVKTGVDNAIDETSSELSSMAGNTATLRQQIRFLFQYFRNRRTVTSSLETSYKDDNATPLGTSSIFNDGSVATKGKMG